MGDTPNQRDLETGIERDFSRSMSYGDYLRLDVLLSAQQPLSRPAAARRAALHRPAPDERAVAQADDPRAALGPRPAAHRRPLPRAQADGAGQAHPAHVDRPVVRPRHAHAQRVRRDPPVPRDQLRLPVRAVPRGRVPAGQQERRHGQGLRPRRGHPRHARRPCCTSRRSTTSSWPTSRARGTTYRSGCWTATGRCPTRSTRTSSTCSRQVYASPAEHWGVYETCEELVDVEDAFQQWRFRHLQVVQRVIGHKTGTGGSSGVDFLRRALDLTFFPELYEVRTRIGQ